jgi:hypothetical protein
MTDYIMMWNINSQSKSIPADYALSLKVTGGTPPNFSPKVGECIKWKTPYNDILFDTLNVDIHSGPDCTGEKLNSTKITMITEGGNTFPSDDKKYGGAGILKLDYNPDKSKEQKPYRNYFCVTAPSLEAGPPIITNAGWSSGQGNTDSKPTVRESFWVQDYGMDEPKRWTAQHGAIFQSTNKFDKSGNNKGSRAYPIRIVTGAPTWKVSPGADPSDGVAFEGLWQIDIKIGSNGRKEPEKGRNSTFCETFYLSERYDLRWGPDYYSDGLGGGDDEAQRTKKVPKFGDPPKAYSREIDIMETKWTDGCPQFNLPDPPPKGDGPKGGGTAWNDAWNVGKIPDYEITGMTKMPPWTDVGGDGGAPPADFVTFGCLIRRDPNPSNKPESEVGGKLWLYAYKPVPQTRWYCTKAIPKLNKHYNQEHPFAPYIGTWCYPEREKPGGFETGYKNFIYLRADDRLIKDKNPYDDPEFFGPALIDDKTDVLYVVNYDTSATAKKYVVTDEDRRPPNRPRLEIGPRSFVRASAKQVTGKLPWYVADDPTGRPLLTKVDKLPAVISFAYNCLTAVAYPATPSTLISMNDILYVANYHDLKLTGHFVVPTGKDGFRLEIGPHSFVSVTTQQVGGSGPWYVASVPSERPSHYKVWPLPAVFSFSTSLTAVAYPAK